MCHVCAMAAFVIKAVLTNSTLGLVLAMASVVLSTLSLPLETVMIPLMSGDLFGSAAYNKVLGVFMAMNSLGLCIGSPLGDLYYDTFGTYKPCFWFFTVLLLVVTICYRFVIRAAYKDKEAFLAEKAENA
jgi:predicted MFS family arabinose efflux permease